MAHQQDEPTLGMATCKVLGLVCLMVLPGVALGDVTLGITDDNSDGDGNTSMTTVAPGESVDIDITLGATTEGVSGVGFWLQEVTNAGFHILSRVIKSSTFSEANAVGQVGGSPTGDLDPINEKDLGVIDPNLAGVNGPFTDPLQTITLDTTDVPAGTYTISTGDSGVPGSDGYTDNSTFDAHALDGHGSYEVTVTGSDTPSGQFALTVSVVGGGTVNPSGGTFVKDTIVTLTATPQNGFRVKTWTGADNDPATGSSINTATMNSDRNIIVEFEEIPTTTNALSASVVGSNGTVVPESGTFATGTVVTLTAMPDVGYRVKAWSGTDSGPSAGINTISITVDQDRTVKVEFEPVPPDTYALSASVMGGNGTVSPTNDVLAEGTVVALTATPAAGFRVKSWSGTDNDPSPGSATNFVTMDSNKTVLVEFEPVPPATFVLDASVDSGNGLIVPTRGVFNVGTVVTVTALPEPGFRVLAWTGTNDDASTANTNTVTMTSDRSAGVAFEAIPVAQFDLTIDVMSGNGDVSPPGGLFDEGDVVTLTAIPDPGYRVKAWTGTNHDPSVGNDTNTVTMDGDKNVTVEFEQIPNSGWALIAFSSSGKGTVTPAKGLFENGAVVTLTAIPDSGFRVLAWNGTDDDASTAKTNTVTMIADRLVSVAFEPVPVVLYQLTVEVIGGNGTLDPGSEAFEQGTVVPLTATPDPGYRAKAWTGTDQDPAAGSDGNIVTMNGDRNVTVQFEPIPPQTFELTASVAGGSGIVVPAAGNYDENAVVNLQAVPDVGLRVLSWHGTDNDGSTDVTNTVTMNANRVVTVEFEAFVDCNSNGTNDATDLANSTSADCDANGVPDECQADSDNDGVIDSCDPDASSDTGQPQTSNGDSSGAGDSQSSLSQEEVVLLIFGIPILAILLAFLFMFLL